MIPSPSLGNGWMGILLLIKSKGFYYIFKGGKLCDDHIDNHKLETHMVR